MSGDVADDAMRGYMQEIVTFVEAKASYSR
jgi:hypothetical protein